MISPRLFPALLVLIIAPLATLTQLAFADSDPSAITAPLARPEDSATFEKSYGVLLREARAGSLEDRQSTSELLRRKSAATLSPGLKYLLLSESFNLACEGKLPADQIETIAEQVMALLPASSLPAASARVDILLRAQTAGVKAEGHFSNATVAEAYLDLAEIQLRLGRPREALNSADRAEECGKNSEAMRQLYASRIATLRKQTQEDLNVDAALLAKPEDPDANMRKGLRLLDQPTGLRDAGLYLSKSSTKEFQALGRLLQVKQSNNKERLELATALNTCLPLVSEKQQLSIAWLLYQQVREILSDSKADEADRARAELLSIKVEKLLGKTKSGVAADAVKRGKTIPEVLFFGLSSGESPSVIFVLDHSGSMLDSFDFLRQSVKRTLASMSPEQHFAVVMFSASVDTVFPAATAPAGSPQPGIARPITNKSSKPLPPRPAIASTPLHLAPATPENKDAAGKWLDQVKAQGENDDLLVPFVDGMRKAMATTPQPHSIYFLTDGNFDPNAVAKIREMNAAKKVKINTIAFVKITKEAEQNLKQIAQENGGQYKFVGEKDLGH